MNSFKLGDNTPFDQAIAFLAPLVGRTIQLQKGGPLSTSRGRTQGIFLRVEMPTATTTWGVPKVVISNDFAPSGEIKASLDMIVEITVKD